MRDREYEQGRGREGDTELKQAPGSKMSAQSPKLTDHKIEVGRLTDWATQAPQQILISCIFIFF